MLKIFGIFETDNFWNYHHCEFYFLTWKINKLVEFFQLGKPKFSSKNWQFWNRSSIRYSAPLAILPILIFVV